MEISLRPAGELGWAPGPTETVGQWTVTFGRTSDGEVGQFVVGTTRVDVRSHGASHEELRAVIGGIVEVPADQFSAQFSTKAGEGRR